MTTDHRHIANYKTDNDSAVRTALQSCLDARSAHGTARLTASEMADAAGLPSDKSTLQSIGRVLDAMGYQRARHDGRRVFLITADAPRQAEAPAHSLQAQVDALRAENASIRAEMAELRAMVESMAQAKRTQPGAAFAEIRQAIDPVLPTLDGKISAEELANYVGLAWDHATGVRIGQYLRSLGIKRGRNANSRYYWFKRQRPNLATVSHEPVTDPFA